MNILAIDTANEYLSLAISSNNKISYKHIKVGNRQSEHILPELEILLKENGLTIQDINLITYNQGPGAFTGLRIGLSCALGLAYSINCDLLPIPAFAPYVNSKTISYEYTIVALDARLGQIYLAAIKQSDYNYCIEPQLVNPEDLPKIILEYGTLLPTNTILTGAGIQVYREKFEKEFIDSYAYIEQEYPPAVNMLELADKGYYPKCSVFEAELLYVRNKVAMDINEQRLSKQS